MKKALGIVILFVLIFTMASPMNVFAKKDTSTSVDYKALTEEEIKKWQTENVFEIVISKFLLSLGDYAHNYLTQLFRQEVTIDKIVFNKVILLNANFFEESANPSMSDASEIVREIINKWYAAFRTIALLVCVTAIVAAGIKILLGTPEGKASALEIFKKVVLGITLALLFPYAMKLGFDINEAIINLVQVGIISGNYNTNTYTIKQVSDLQLDEDLEFRSPMYVSNASLNLSAGSDEATAFFMSKLQTYAQDNDVMRIMRAYAGVTLRFMYIVIWYIFLVQTYFLVYTYLKRYVTIAFLITIYPLTVIGYVTGGLLGRSKTAFNEWCSRFFGNVFMQTIHAITYGVISCIVIDQVKNGLPDKINWLLMIMAITFLFTGEKILDNLWHLATSASEGKGELGNVLKNSKNAFKQIRGK